MTLKQDEVIKRLPQNGYNLAKTMREVGYSKQTSRSGAQYAILRKKMEKAYDPEQIKAEVVKARKYFAKTGDNSNLSRMLELQCKISGLGKDTPTAIQVNVMQELSKDIDNVTDEQSNGENTEPGQGIAHPQDGT